MIKLYCFGESGNAYKAALPLALSGLAWQPVFVDFFNGGARTSEFIALNPMGEVPVLVDGALTLSQSGVIQHYISEKTGCFAGHTATEQREILRWILWDNHKLSSLAGITRFLCHFVPTEKRPHAVIDWLQGRLRKSYSVLDAALANRAWLVGNEPSNADFSCCGYLYYPEYFGFDRAAYPNVDAWLTRLSAIPNWQHPYDLMQRAFPPVPK